MQNFVSGVLDPRRDNRFLVDLRKWQRPLATLGLVNALAELTLKFTSPGFPDIYQGQECWAFRLVDPDNRQPVDFAAHERLLSDLRHSATDASQLRNVARSWPLTWPIAHEAVRHLAVARNASSFGRITEQRAPLRAVACQRGQGRACRGVCAADRRRTGRGTTGSDRRGAAAGGAIGRLESGRAGRAISFLAARKFGRTRESNCRATSVVRFRMCSRASRTTCRRATHWPSCSPISRSRCSRG